MPNFLVEELKSYTNKIYELKAEERIFPITNRAMQKKMKQKVDKLGLGYLDVSTTRNV